MTTYTTGFHGQFHRAVPASCLARTTDRPDQWSWGPPKRELRANSNYGFYDDPVRLLRLIRLRVRLTSPW